MDFQIKDYSEFNKDNIGMSPAEWDRARGLPDEDVMRIYWEGMVWADGFPDCLRGLPLEEQIDHYVVREDSEYSRSSYGEVDRSHFSSGRFVPLKDYKRFRGVIVKDGIVVGAIVSDYYRNWKYLYPGRPQCLYWDVDTDGTGSSSSDVYVSMYSVPFEK